MNYYNIYYRNKKINNTLISEKEKSEILKFSYIYKQENNKKIKIPVSSIKFISCVII